MYAIRNGMNCPFLAVLFCIFTLVAAFGIGNLVQSNAVASYAHSAFGIKPWIMGIFEAVMIGLVVLGGMKAISKVCEALVPVMAVFYVIGCILVLCANSAYIFPSVQLILKEAFGLA